MASRASRPPVERGQLVEEGLVLDVLQECHHVGMRPDHVRDVEQRQPHFRRDVAGDGLGERVGRVLLAQPLLQPLVQPPGGLHPRQDHREALRVEHEPPQLLDVREDEVDQRRAGLAPDVALQGGDRGPAALDQLGDDGRIGLDRGGRAAGRRLARAPVRERRDEAVAFEDGLQRVADQRIGLPHDLQEPARLAGEASDLGDVDEQPAAGLGHRPGGRQLPQGEPQGLHRVGHHLLVADGDVDVVALVAGSRGWGTAW